MPLQTKRHRSSLPYRRVNCVLPFDGNYARLKARWDSARMGIRLDRYIGDRMVEIVGFVPLEIMQDNEFFHGGYNHRTGSPDL